MKYIALISCTKSKMDYPCTARELYSKSNLFRHSINYADLVADEVYILSAKYGLVADDDVIEPYDETLLTQSAKVIDAWAGKVADRLAIVADLDKDCFIILAGKVYYDKLLFRLKNYRLPLEGVSLFNRPGVLEELVNVKESEDACMIMHKLFNSLPRYSWKDIEKVPFDDGIYLLFEEGEKYQGLDRVTHVGSNKSDGRLKDRLKDHFIKEKKDGSILRKSLGRALLNKVGHSYLEIWDMNMSNAKVKAMYGHLYDRLIEEGIEVEVTRMLRNHFTVALLQVKSSEDRLRLKKGIIATLFNDGYFKPGPSWLGLNSPVKKISQSGLWNVQSLGSVPLTNQELEVIKQNIRLA